MCIRDRNWVVNHAYNVASYLLTSGNEIDSGETVDGIKDGYMDRSISGNANTKTR